MNENTTTKKEYHTIRFTDPNDRRSLDEAREAGDLIELSGLAIICTRDHKGRRIVPDDVMDEYKRELPEGTRSTDGRAAYNGGCLRMLDAINQEEAAEIRRQGAETLNATHAQRRSIAETIDTMLKSKAPAEDVELYGLQEGATKQEVLVAAMYAEAVRKGTVRAFDSLRDTVGEKPIDRQQVQADIMTEADKILIEKIKKRLDHNI